MVDPPCLVPAVPLAIWWKMLVTSHRQAKHCWSTHCIQCGHICTWCIPCICRCPTYTWYIHGISMVILCISISGYTMYIHRNGCTWYIHGYTMYIHTVYTSKWYIHGYTWIYMVYHLMYIHGIYVVYPWIFLDIPSFLKPDFDAGQCCWSHSMRTRVWVIKSVLFHAPPWELWQGKRQPTKGSTLLQPTFPLCRLRQLCRRRRWWCHRRLSVFLVLLQATTWILVKDGAEGAFRAGDHCVEQLRCLPVLKNSKDQEK